MRGTQGRRGQRQGANPAAGAVLGAILFLLGFGFTHVLKSGKVKEVIGPGATNAPETWRVVGWVFYRMHYVKSAYTTSGGGQTESQTLEIASSQQWATVWDGWLLLVPPLLLTIGGALLARRGGPIDAAEGAKRGATLAIGYLPLAAIGAYAVRWRTVETGFGGTVYATAGPDLVQAALIAGLGYSLLFGALGGAVAAVTSGSGSPAGPGQRRARAPEQPRNDRRTGRHSDGPQGHRGNDRRQENTRRNEQTTGDRRRSGRDDGRGPP